MASAVARLPAKTASDRRDAEIERQPGREHGVLQRVRDRRDEGKRRHRHRVEIIRTDIAGDEPAAGHQQADNDTCCNLAGRTPERRVRESKQDQRNDNCGSSQRARDRFTGAERRQQ